MSIRRMLPFIFLNIIVSLVVVLAVLFWWDSQQTAETQELPAVTPIIMTAPEATNTAEAFAQQEATPEPTPGPRVYVVQAGDTLGIISQNFNVSMQEIMEANGLTNPNILHVGQELIIPIGGIDQTAPLPTPTPTPDLLLPSPIPTQPLDVGEFRVEITEVIAPGRLAEEAIVISNSGDRPVALLNWQLSDDAGHVYTFGQVTLFGDGAAIVVHTGSGRDGSADLYWNLEQAVWRSGVAATLRDADGEEQAVFVVE